VGTTEIIERERRWATPVALLTMLAVVLFAISLVLLASTYSADGNAEVLQKIDEDSGNFVLASILRGFGAALLVVPIVYLFQAASARSEAMRRQLIGLAIIGPLFLAAATFLNAFVLPDAASDFVARGVVGSGDHADEIANNVISDQSLQGLGVGLLIGGGIAFAIGTAYTCFYAMRTGLLTRFLGSLGMALAVVSVINAQFFQFMLLWIAYFGLLVGGWTPRGRPPAWAAGEAIPWPTPGERAAESLQGEAEPGDDHPPAADAEPGTGAEGGGEEPTSASPPGEGGERRKRKRRR
jgi:drug/metabolite transporter (DMT)-like permease